MIFKCMFLKSRLVMIDDQSLETRRNLNRVFKGNPKSILIERDIERFHRIDIDACLGQKLCVFTKPYKKRDLTYFIEN